jgi:hypothetical protein
MRFGAAVLCANEWRFAPAVLGQLLKVCENVVVLRGQRSLSGAPLVLGDIPPLDPRVLVVTDTWKDEADTRNAGMQILKDCDYVFTVDSDEILSDRALEFITSTCEMTRPRALLGGCHTYWKTPDWRIDPPEKLVAPLVVRKDVRFERLRMFSGEHTIVNQYLFHHLSYVRTDEEMKEKLRLFGHASEVLLGWYEDVWKAWDDNHTLENLHPTHPSAFKRAVPSDGSVKTILAAYGSTGA